MLSDLLYCHLFIEISVRPSSGVVPIAGKPFSLQCHGPEDAASITWLKNKQPLSADAGRVRFSPDNSSVTFSPLLRTDGGTYQCSVLEAGNVTQRNDSQLEVEAGAPILSVGYTLQVNCELYQKCEASVKHFRTGKVILSMELNMEFVLPSKKPE